MLIVGNHNLLVGNHNLLAGNNNCLVERKSLFAGHNVVGRKS
jgi:hypothetical protein